MTAVWFEELNQVLREFDPQAEETQSSIWTELKTRVDINQYQPHQWPEVLVKEIHDKTEHYFVLKNTSQKTYLRLSPEEYTLWKLIDGNRTVKDLVVEHYVRSGAFSYNLVIQLVNQLFSHQLLVEKPIYTWDEVKTQLDKRSLSHKLIVPARLLLSQRLNIPGIDKMMSGLYRALGWIFFTRPMQIIMALIAIVGLVLFNQIVTGTQYAFFSQTPLSDLALFWVAAILPVMIHELGHALTVKHYGREINGGGLMLYFGLPAAFVDTTDIWLENRKARLNVTWNGPYTGLLIGGICAILMWLYPENAINSFLFKIASVAYLTILININPLLKYDGYYILSDSMNISFLRERSLNFLRKGLIGKLSRREKLTPNEKIFSVFGILSVLWTAYAIYLATIFWQTRISTSLQVIMGSNFNLVTKVFEFLSTAAFVSMLGLLIFQLIRIVLNLLTRFVRAGGLQKHSQLALIGFTFASLISFGTAYSVEIYRGWVVVGVVSGMSVLTLIVFLVFNQAYAISNRWAAQIFLGLTLLALALVPLAEELMPTGSSHSQRLLFAGLFLASLGGVLFIWPAIKQFKFLQLAVGLLIGGFLVVGGNLLQLSAWHAALVSLLGFVTTLNWFSLRGSGRFPALLLIFLGAASASIAFDLTRYIPRYWGVGILISCAGAWHMILARLPNLSRYEPIISANKQDAIRDSVMILVKRIIAQVFFESGWGGIDAFGQRFTARAKNLGIDLSIDGNQFRDGELPDRATIHLTEVYGAAFDQLFDLMKDRFGKRQASRIFSLGVDLIPWQYREVTIELVLMRRDWGMQVGEANKNKRSDRVKLLGRVPMFSNATPGDLIPIASMLTPRQYAAREVVIRQGDPGNEFFIIESGKLQVWQTQEAGEPRLVQSLGPGQFFGEVALINNAPRNATIIAETPSVLLSLKREDFDSLVKHHLEFMENIKSNLRNSWILRNMPIFDELSGSDLNTITDKLKVEHFKAGVPVIREGDIGDKFYIIEDGELAAYQEINGDSLELERLTSGDYFGETALILNRPRNATIIPVSDSTLFSLEREDFVNLMDDFQNMRQLVDKTSTRRMKNLI